MKTLSLKEKLKDNLRALQINDVRQYHLTHDFYSGRKLNSNCRFDQAQNDEDHQVLVEKQDLDFINTLLYPDPTIGSVFADAFAELTTELSVTNKEDQNTIQQITIKKPSEDLVCRFQRYYEHYLNKGLSELLSTQSEKLSSQSIAVIKRAYSGNIILIQNICILSEFWIRTPFSWKPDGKISLLEHLFIQYEAPACLKKCWNKTATQENLQWLIIFLMYVQGGSIKRITNSFEWKVANNKLWHELFNVPAYMSPEQAVMYCELSRLQASENIYQYITANQAYLINPLTHPNPETVEFWYSMVRWLVINEDKIIGTEMARMLIWARHQFTEFEKTDKKFTMNGRSFTKVQAETQAYHYAIIARQREIARRAEQRRQAAIEREQEMRDQAADELLDYMYSEEYSGPYKWKKLGLSWMLATAKLKYKFIELTTTEELEAEGTALNHCVGSYDKLCANGQSAVVSLRLNGIRKITIEIDPESLMLVQASGYENRDLTQYEKEVVENWLKEVVSRLHG